MWWLAVHLPWLSLEAYCCMLPAAERERPVALVSDHRISAANAAAARFGIRPGIKRATALALVSDLLLGEADPSRDHQALQSVAHAALAFTPSVCIDGHSVMLEVQSCLRYFGGASSLLARLRQALVPLGHHAQIASAPTALGAALLARWRDDLSLGPHSTQLSALQALLDEVPVWLLGPGREHWEALQGMGLQRLSDLRHLPRSGLARRFGEPLLDDLDRARGVRPDPRLWITVPDRFESRLELAMRADHAQQVLQAAAVLLARLVGWARAGQSRVCAFTLQMQHEPRHRCAEATPCATTLRIELAEPSRDPAHLQLLLRERLAQVVLPAPTLELLIECSEVAAGGEPNGELFPAQRQAERGGLMRLLEHLRARLGDGGVLQLQAVADHRPEKASRSLPALVAQPHLLRTSRNVLDGLEVLEVLPLAHPVWLLPDPLPLAESDALPLLDGVPLQLLSGPERIETGWWDGGLAVRDYFIASTRDGSLVWVYRSRAQQASAEQMIWFLQGRFG